MSFIEKAIMRSNWSRKSKPDSFFQVGCGSAHFRKGGM
jgi:hypothetical protein